MKDFSITDRQITVTDKYFGYEKLNSYFADHKLITDNYTDKDITMLIDSVAYLLDSEMIQNSDILIIEKFLGADYNKKVEGWYMAFYTEKQVSDMLQLGKKKTHALFQTEGFPAIKIGRDYRVEVEAFKKWAADTKEISNLNYEGIRW